VHAGGEVLALLRELAAEGRAIVLVTHEASAAAIAHRVLRLEAGRLVAA
jgi:ABC-type lipoprotein export system ATPase subunit